MLVHSTTINPTEFVTVFVGKVREIGVLGVKRITAVVALGHTALMVLHPTSAKKIVVGRGRESGTASHPRSRVTYLVAIGFLRGDFRTRLVMHGDQCGTTSMALDSAQAGGPVVLRDGRSANGRVVFGHHDVEHR